MVANCNNCAVLGQNEPDNEVHVASSGSSALANGITDTDTQSVDSLNSEEYDKVTDVDQDKNIFRTKVRAL